MGNTRAFIDDKDVVRLNAKKSFLLNLKNFMSWPPFYTSHFNVDGRLEYRTTIQAMIVMPMVCIFVLLMMSLVLPLFSDQVVSIKFDDEDLNVSYDYGFETKINTTKVNETGFGLSSFYIYYTNYFTEVDHPLYHNF